MKYIVMENRISHSVVMDENGVFHRVANLGYEIGDTITEPFFMKSPEYTEEQDAYNNEARKDELSEKRRDKFNWKKLSTIAAIFVCLLLAGIPVINSNTFSDVVVYMSINPEIHLELNEDGKINRLVADNEDGKKLLDGYKYRGKNVASVLVDLVDRAEKLDYLSEGGEIKITVQASDEVIAKTVQVDLSEVLDRAYVKKYLIKIKANEENFRRLEDVLKEENKGVRPEAIETTLKPDEMSSEYEPTEQYTETTHTHSENNNEATKPTQSNKPTEKPTVITRPTEKPTVATKPTKPTEPVTENPEPEKPSVDEEKPTSGTDEDWEWPWWPYNLD